LLKATLNKKKKERRKKKERKETDNMESQNEQLGFTNQAIIAAKILSQNSFPKTICIFFPFSFYRHGFLGHSTITILTRVMLIANLHSCYTPANMACFE